jgi:hypothetical protein
VTGRGNIRASRLHARKVAEWIMRHYLKWEVSDQDRLRDILSTPGRQKAFKKMVAEKKVVPGDKIKRISKQVTLLQNRVGYAGNYSDWISEHSPIRLEKLNERTI